MELRQEMDGLRHLLFFTSVQFLVYADRMVFNGLVPTIETHFQISSSLSGLCGSCFLGGFMIMAPVSAFAGAGQGGPRVIGLGLCLWLLAVIATGLAPNYGTLLAARTLAGCGEAAYATLALPIIDDTAPSGQKSLFTAVYFTSIFVGAAAGFALQAPFSTWGLSRLIFLVEAVVMAPLVAFILKFQAKFRILSEAVTARARSFSDDEREKPASWRQQVSTVLRVRVYVFLVLGYCATVFVIGGFSFWAPAYVEQALHVDKQTCGLRLAAITMISGVAGTMGGGCLLDKMAGHGRQQKRSYAAAKISLGCAAGAVPCLVVVASSQDALVFFPAIGLGEIFLFMSAAPANIAMMESTPSHLRGVAMGLCTLASHALGDLIPPVLIGVLRDATGTLRPGIWILALWSVWAVLFWYLALRATSSTATDTEAEGLELMSVTTLGALQMEDEVSY